MVRSTRGEGQTNQLRDRKVTSRQQNDQHSKCSSRVRHGQEQVCCSVTDMRQPVSSTELIGQLTRAIQSLSNQLPTARYRSRIRARPPWKKHQIGAYWAHTESPAHLRSSRSSRDPSRSISCSRPTVTRLPRARLDAERLRWRIQVRSSDG